MIHSKRWNKKRRGAVGAAHLERLRSLYGLPKDTASQDMNCNAETATTEPGPQTGEMQLSKEEFWNSLSHEERRPLVEAKKIFGELEVIKTWKR